MDITPLFKACVKTARLRDKSLQNFGPDKRRILKNSSAAAHANAKNDFLKASQNIRHQISQLRDLLVENRVAYMQIADFLKDTPKMSDAERDIIDNESEKIVNICAQLINDFRYECRQRRPSKQFAQHLDGVIDLLVGYLKAVDGFHKHQKEYRVARQIESYKLLKLGAGKAKKTSSIGMVVSGEEEIDDEKGPTSLPDDDRDEGMESDEQEEGAEAQLERRPKTPLSHKLSFDEDELNNSHSFFEEDEMPSFEDVQILEQENKQLFSELQGLSEEVEQIEKNVVDIARLQDLFTEKVTLQKSDIERIAETVVGATENVKDANEQIKQAIQRNAGLRVWVLFFLLVMSFSLLFLDWYND